MAGKKKPKTPPPESFSDEQRKRIRDWTRQNHPEYMREGPGGLKDLIADMLLWHRMNEVDRRDWVTTAYRWIKKDARMRFDYAVRNGREIPQELRTNPKQTEPEPIQETLRLIQGGKK